MAHLDRNGHVSTLLEERAYQPHHSPSSADGRRLGVAHRSTLLPAWMERNHQTHIDQLMTMFLAAALKRDWNGRSRRMKIGVIASQAGHRLHGQPPSMVRD
ncbi:hypothetical protein [Mesorhizobium sp.]|uniref:hypothetical protein n=1 Tax=Mesorhizobium sp. TaxID=1871066 RepID=UPI0012238BE5|nr:hypothetical protein [Mesorhizobium sp.]TIL40308.1 MAG: hypothetical protein E5Y86_32785 [Mesorhizobium sp.]